MMGITAGVNVINASDEFGISRYSSVPADVSKRGVDDGNQKGGGSPQPAKES